MFGRCALCRRCTLSRALLLRSSAYYRHAARCISGAAPASSPACPRSILLPMHAAPLQGPLHLLPTCSFGAPPDHTALDIGHRGVALLAAALVSGTATPGPATLPHFLQAASYLPVCPTPAPGHLGAALRALQHPPCAGSSSELYISGESIKSTCCPIACLPACLPAPCPPAPAAGGSGAGGGRTLPAAPRAGQPPRRSAASGSGPGAGQPAGTHRAGLPAGG